MALRRFTAEAGKLCAESSNFLYELDIETSEMHASLLLCSGLPKNMWTARSGLRAGTGDERDARTLRILKAQHSKDSPRLRATGIRIAPCGASARLVARAASGVLRARGSSARCATSFADSIT